MITIKEASEVLSLTPQRIKQILNEKEIGHIRTQHNNGQIKILPDGMASLMHLRKKQIRKRKVILKGQKGGLGSTSLCLITAIRASQKYGAKILIIDCDSEANSSSYLAPEGFSIGKSTTLYEMYRDDLDINQAIVPTRYANIDMIPAKGLLQNIDKIIHNKNPKTLLRAKLKDIENRYDIIYFDLPPNYSKLSESAYITADLIIIPFDNSSFSIEALYLTTDNINSSLEEYEIKDRPEISILANKFSPQRVSSQEAWKVVNEAFPTQLLPFTCRESVEIVNSLNAGYSPLESGRKIKSDVKVGLDELTDYICSINQNDEQERKH